MIKIMHEVRGCLATEGVGGMVLVDGKKFGDANKRIKSARLAINPCYNHYDIMSNLRALQMQFIEKSGTI